MFTFRISRRQNISSRTRRSQALRQPLVEALEGRQLLSTFTATDFKKTVPPDSLSHRVAPAIVGAHIGTAVAAIQGNHIGTNIVGAHIGTNIVGAHIGTSVARKM